MEYVTSLEVACQNLNINAAEELRSEMYRTLRYSDPQAQSEERKNEGTETTEIREEPDGVNSR